MLGRQKPQSQSKKHNRASLVLPALLLASNIGDGSCFSIINVPKGKTAVAPSLSKSNRSESTQLLNAMSSTESYLHGLSNAVDLVTNVDPAQAAVVSETVKNMFMTTASSEAEALTVETTLDVAKATMEVVQEKKVFLMDNHYKLTLRRKQVQPSILLILHLLL